MRRLTRSLVGKRIVGVIYATMSSNNQDRLVQEALVLEDSRGRQSYLRWSTVEETDAAYYGTELIYPGRGPGGDEDLDVPRG